MLFICLESTIIWILLELVSLGSDTCDFNEFDISESYISEWHTFKILFEIGDFSFQIGFQNAAFKMLAFKMLLGYYFIMHLDYFHFRWFNVSLSSYGFYNSCGMNHTYLAYAII